MKGLLLLVLLASSAMAQTQNTPLVDYLLRLQYDTSMFYNSMTIFYRDVRAAMSRYLVMLNEVMLTEVTNALRTIIEVREETQQIIDQGHDNALCLETVTEMWDEALNYAGYRFSVCSRNVIMQVDNATDNLFMFLVDEKANSFELQNSIVTALSQINSVLDRTNLTPFVSNHTNEIYMRFNLEVYPELINMLSEFPALMNSAPTQLRECFDSNVINRLRDDSIVIRNTLELC